MPTENIRTRLANVAEQHQQPKDRLWAVVFVLIGLVLLLGLIVVLYAEAESDFLDDGRELGYERGAIECQQNILDNERVGGLPAYCGRVEVQVYYPPELCEVWFPDSSDCADKWVEG